MTAAQARVEREIEAGMTMINGSKIAKISKLNGRYNVYVGYKGTNCPGEEILPARHFKGYTTCSQDFKTANNAVRAANKFLGFYL